jgi:hypothetical protein
MAQRSRACNRHKPLNSGGMAKKMLRSMRAAQVHDAQRQLQHFR